MATLTVAGTSVVVRDRLPARVHYALPRAINANVGAISFEEQVGPLAACVESWEFAGDPADLNAWAELDVFSEFLPLWNALVSHFVQRMVGQLADQKN